MFKKVLIIGLGLMGGSLALALRKAKISQQIFAFNRDQSSLEFALENKIIDGFISLQNDLTSFDLIIIATPLGAYKNIALEISDKVHQDAILTDLGSLKNFTFELISSQNFVATHPIAGLEKTGVQNALANLFVGKNLIICQGNNTNTSALKKIELLWQKVGANVKYLDAKKHDEIYALVSHLPQFLAFIFQEITPCKAKNILLQKALRLENSSIEPWKDIFALNKENLKNFATELLVNLQESANLDLESLLLMDSRFRGDSVVNSGGDGATYDADQFTEITPFFAEIMTRVIVISAFLRIKKIAEYQSFSGSGFRDFTSLIRILQNSSAEKAECLQNKVKIAEYLENIKNRIKQLI